MRLRICPICRQVLKCLGVCVSVCVEEEGAFVFNLHGRRVITSFTATNVSKISIFHIGPDDGGTFIFFPPNGWEREGSSYTYMYTDMYRCTETTHYLYNVVVERSRIYAVKLTPPGR